MKNHSSVVKREGDKSKRKRTSEQHVRSGERERERESVSASLANRLMISSSVQFALWIKKHH